MKTLAFILAGLLLNVCGAAGATDDSASKVVFTAENSPVQISIDELIRIIRLEENQFNAQAVEVSYFLTPDRVRSVRIDELREQLKRLTSLNLRTALLKHKVELETELRGLLDNRLHLEPVIITERYSRIDSPGHQNPFLISSYMGASVTKITLLKKDKTPMSANHPLLSRVLSFCGRLLGS